METYRSDNTMSAIQFQSREDVHDMQIEHLRSQHDHLKFMYEYHSWMKSEMSEPGLSVLHGTVVDKVNEALEQLDQLIEALQLASLSETAKAPPTQ